MRRKPRFVKPLRPGQSATVGMGGKRRVKTAENLRREAKEIFPEDRPKVNFTEIMKKMKK